jgi:hypothetical protein
MRQQLLQTLVEFSPGTNTLSGTLCIELVRFLCSEIVFGAGVLALIVLRHYTSGGFG